MKSSTNQGSSVLDDFADWLRQYLGKERAGDNYDADGFPLTKAPESSLPHNPADHHHSGIDGIWHCYRITKTKYWTEWKQKNKHAYSQQNWYCESILDAHYNYAWQQGLKRFTVLATDLQSAMQIGKQKDVNEACIKILSWGGTTLSENMKIWFSKGVRNGTLAQQLQDATNLLRGSSTAPLDRFNAVGDLPMNSGMSKIYAAVAINTSTGANDVLIYDGRVGAALCLFVRRYCIAHNLSAIPEPLNFRWSSGRRYVSSEGEKYIQCDGDNADRRNPSDGYYKFIQLGSNPFRHAELARRGAYVIQRLMQSKLPTPLFTKVERGLFMIGYDVRYLCCECRCNRKV